MKKLIALLLALTMVLALAACGTTPPATDPSESNPPATNPPATNPPETDPPETTPAAPAIAAGTSWNAIDTYDKTGAEDSVWKYYFFDGNDSSFNPMGGYEERNDGTLCSWYPWEGCWVGLGFNADMQGFLEMNSDGTTMTSVLGFVAPADGKYVITGTVQNPWEQPTDLFRVTKVEAANVSDIKAAGTTVLEQDISGLNAIYGYLTSTVVELKAGDLLRFYCPSVDGNWVSAYANITMHYEPTDESVYVTPENPEAPVEPEEPIPAVEGATYSASAEFSTESNDGIWVYATTTDGLTYTLTTKYEAQDWDGDGAPNASQWYSANGTGLGFNFDVEHYLELNVSETPENGGEITALGFKAPAAGTYQLTLFTKNFWGQSSNGVVVHQNGVDVATVPFEAAQTQQTIELTLAEGEIVYIHGTSAGGWVSTYVAAFVVAG